MPYNIKLSRPPAGYVAEHVEKGEEATIITRDFVSSEDGMRLINMLEQLPSSVLSSIPELRLIKPSTIDHLLIHFDSDGNATIYVNEINMIGKVKTRKAVEAGQAVYIDDLVHLLELRFEGIDIPPDHSVLVVLSSGWRKGLFFDFSPMTSKLPREYDIWSILGGYYSYIIFQEHFSISEETWNALLMDSWFPFIGLNQSTIKEIIAWSSSGRSADALLDKITAELLERLPQIKQNWTSAPLLKEHVALLNVAAERFEAKDWISTNSILYPRIEGILRTITQSLSETTYSQKNLASAAEKISRDIAGTRIFPTKFQQYLTDVYFKSFDPENPTSISRNSVGHGVAPANEFSEKSAVIGLLIVEQIFFHLPSPIAENEDPK